MRRDIINTMSQNEEQITYFAETDFRNQNRKFGIKAKDRTRHMYIIGKTGMGKSTLLENLAIQDINNGNGMAFIDPHGGTAETFLEYIPEHRIKDVVYFAPHDVDMPVSFNVMEDVDPDKRHLVASGLMSSFKKIWVDAWSARMEYILGNVLLALLEYPGSTILGVNRMLADKAYRKRVVSNISDPSVKAFWVDEFEKYGERYMQEAGASIQNKIGQFISNPVIRNIVGQEKSSFDIRDIMDNKKILIMNLSKGQIGESNAALLGGMLITKIYLGAMSRADVGPEGIKDLPNFYFFVDEFQSFSSDSFADILSEARKYKLNLTIAHQYVEQMSEEVRAAVFGNVGSLITFRVGSFDAEIFEKEFGHVFLADDIVNLGFTQVYLRLMIDGVGSKPFSARTMNRPEKPALTFKDEVLKNSRETYGQKRSDIAAAISEWMLDGNNHQNNNNQNNNHNKNPQNKGNHNPNNQNKKNKPVERTTFEIKGKKNNSQDKKEEEKKGVVQHVQKDIAMDTPIASSKLSDLLNTISSEHTQAENKKDVMKKIEKKETTEVSVAKVEKIEKDTPTQVLPSQVTKFTPSSTGKSIIKKNNNTSNPHKKEIQKETISLKSLLSHTVAKNNPEEDIKEKNIQNQESKKESTEQDQKSVQEIPVVKYEEKKKPTSLKDALAGLSFKDESVLSQKVHEEKEVNTDKGLIENIQESKTRDIQKDISKEELNSPHLIRENEAFIKKETSDASKEDTFSPKEDMSQEDKKQKYDDSLFEPRTGSVKEVPEDVLRRILE
ncbi:MAG: hypothetical protein ACI9AR_000426 [Flavobacteriaceae bacterium]|jgi:hypothetical protein